MPIEAAALLLDWQQPLKPLRRLQRAERVLP